MNLMNLFRSTACQIKGKCLELSDITNIERKAQFDEISDDEWPPLRALPNVIVLDTGVLVDSTIVR